jgi:chromate transporter
MRASLAWDLVAVFAPLSLLAFGGGQGIVADIGQQATAHGWVTQREFVDLFAVSRAAPGPGALLATLIGWKAGGWAGAAVASLALFVPSSLLVYAVTVAWTRLGRHPRLRLLENALAPVAAGLLMAGAVAVIRASSGSMVVWLVAAAALAFFLWRPKVDPLLVLACAGMAAMLLGPLLPSVPVSR